MWRLAKMSFLLLLVLAMLAWPSASQAQIAVGVSIRIGPPALPVYPQPICPGPGYIWTPGYWAYGPAGYFWVPGTWVVAPAVGVLWTPGYWGWNAGLYAWHPGYWGPHVGFYGGINYGFGYTGVGFVGGAWHGGVFAYNTAVTNVNTTIIHNTYNTTVINKTVVNNNVSFNGGPGGIVARPTAEEEAAARENHIEATQAQMQHEHTASQNRAMLASENHGRPAIAATSRPGEFTGHGVTAAHAPGNANRPPNSMNGADHAAVRSDRPPNAGQANHNAPNSYHPSGNDRPQESHVNNSHPNNSHPNNEHQNNDRPNNHEGNPHASGHGDRPGR